MAENKEILLSNEAGNNNNLGIPLQYKPPYKEEEQGQENQGNPELKQQQGMQPGMQPMGMQQGYQPMGMQPGYQPVVMQPGMQPGYQPVVMQPGMQPRYQPMVMQPGMQPGYQPVVMQPGMQPRYQPMVMQPGMQPGTQALGQVNLSSGMVLIRGRNFYLIQNPLEELGNASRALIIQEVELMEMITGCELANRYNVFLQDHNGGEKFLFRCKESSSWCQRNCCPAENHEFTLKLKQVIDQNGFNDDFTKPYIEFYNPCKCVCLCFNRPNMKGKFVETNVQFGKIVEEWSCCDPLITVFNRDGVLRFRISTNCCQCGFFCRKNICGRISPITFNIYNGTDLQMNQPIGTIERLIKGVQNIFTDADTFRLTFPQDSSPEEKLLLIGAGLLIDYQYYEDTGGPANPQLQINY